MNNVNGNMRQTPPMGYMAVQRKRKIYKGVETALAVFCVIFGYLFNKFIIGGESPWIMTAVMVCTVIASAVFSKVLGGKPTFFSLLFGLAAVVFSLSFIMTGDGFTTAICLAAALFSLIMSIHKAFDREVEKFPGVFFDLDSVKAVFAKPFASFVALFPAIFDAGRDKNGKKKHILLWAIVGLIFSLVPTLIVIALLSYDKGFSDIMSKLSLDKLDLTPHVISFFFGIPIAMYAFGLWISSSDHKLASFDQKNSKSFKQKIRCIPAPVVIAAITPVLIIYLIFFFSQLEYYVSAFSGQLASGYEIYSEFAREGFFQLCTVTVINALLVLIMYYFMRRKENSLLMRAYTVIISLFTLILIATAFSKMYLYIMTYGLTLNRVYASAFMLLEAAVFLLLIIRMIFRRFRFVAISVLVTAIVIGFFAVADVPAIISDYNTDMVLSGKNLRLDLNYYTQLGASAVPDAVRIENSDIKGSNAIAAKSFLDSYVRSLDENETVLGKTVPMLKADATLKNRKNTETEKVYIDYGGTSLNSVYMNDGRVYYRCSVPIVNETDGRKNVSLRAYFTDRYVSGTFTCESAIGTSDDGVIVSIPVDDVKIVPVTFSVSVSEGHEESEFEDDSLPEIELITEGE